MPIGLYFLFMVQAHLILAGGTNVPLLTYTQRGAFSNIEWFDLKMEADGEAKISYKKQGQEPVTRWLLLNEEELVEIKSTINAVRFFDRPEAEMGHAADLGQSRLSIQLDNQERTLNYNYRPELNLLTFKLWRLVNQAVLTTELELYGDIFSVHAACNPKAAGQRPYCPWLMAAPIKVYIAQCQEKQKLEYALTALAWLLPEKPWQEYVEQVVRKITGEHRLLLLSVLVSYPHFMGVSPGHVRVMLPAMSSALEEYATTEDPPDKATTAVTGDLCWFVGTLNYQPALPALQRVHARHRSPVRDIPMKWGKPEMAHGVICAEWAIKTLQSHPTNSPPITPKEWGRPYSY